MSRQSARHRGSSLGVSFQTINPTLNESLSKNRQMLMKTINFNQRQQTSFQQNEQLIGVLPRNLVSPFKWSNRKFLPQLHQKLRYQQSQNRKQIKEAESNIQQKNHYDLQINKIRQANLTNELQPLLTVRELKGRSLRKRNQLNLTQTKQYRDYQPVQFATRRKYVAPTQPSTAYSLEKVFIFKSKDEFIKKILLSMGWKQSRNQNGYTYHLKWITFDSPADYANPRQGQYFNHIQNSDQLTNKAKLTLNLLNSQNIQFYPRTFDLNTNFLDFASEFIDFGMLSLLKKYIQHISVKALNIYQNPNKTQLGILVKHNNFLNYKRDENFTLNVPLIVSLCFHLQKIKRKLQIVYQDVEVPIEIDLTLDTRIIQTILAYNIIPIQEKPFLKKPLEDKILQAHVLQAKYDTPSDDLVSLLVIYYNLFKKKINGFRINGINNLWILKPTSITKNQNIELINKVQNNNNKFRNKIAQKYIENCLIFKGAKKQNYMWKYVQGKKFDIRQWVLITSQPTRIYKFSSCYLRFCSQNYVFDKQLDQKKNLANYFLNKTRFQSNQQWSILNIQELFSYLLEIQEIDIQDYFNDQMNNIILQTINKVLPKLNLKKNCFQLFGFDLIIDESYKLWLIQVNISPTCDQKTVWMKQMLNKMGSQLLKIILPKQYLYNMKQLKQSKYEWKLLYENGQLMINNEIYIQNKFKYEQQFENHNKKFQGNLITQIKKKLKAQNNIFNLSNKYNQKFKNKLVQVLKNVRPYKNANIYHYNNISLFMKGIQLVIRRHKKVVFKLLNDQYSYDKKYQIQVQETIVKKTPKDLSIIEIPDLYEKFF